MRYAVLREYMYVSALALRDDLVFRRVGAFLTFVFVLGSFILRK